MMNKDFRTETSEVTSSPDRITHKLSLWYFINVLSGNVTLVLPLPHGVYPDRHVYVTGL